MWQVKYIVETADKRCSLVEGVMFVYAGQFLRKVELLHTVSVVESRLGAPTDVHGRCDICLGPIHDLAKFVPVVNILKFHLFNRCSGYDETVPFAVLYAVKILVESVKVSLCHVLGLVGHGSKKRDVHLKWGV